MTAPKLDLILALQLSGDFSQTAARSIRGTFAPRSHHASALAIALFMDNFTTDPATDRFTINDRHSTATEIKDARERADWRNGISANLNAIDEDDFVSIVNALADGRGAQESDRWRQAATQHAAAMLEAIRDAAIVAAVGA